MEVLILVGILLIVIVVVAASLKRGGSESEVHIYDAESTSAPDVSIAFLQRETVDLSKLLPLQFVVLDLETTGLSPHHDEIIEIGAILVTIDSDNHTGFQTLVMPERKVPRRITKITGITQDMVNSEGLQLEDALAQFMEFIGDLPLVTFNAEFDMGFLHNAAKKHGKVINNRYTCALKRARRAWPGLRSYRLVDLAKMGKLSDEDTHRALGDCKRTMIVFTAATSTLGQKVRWTKPRNELSQQTIQEAGLKR